MQMLDKIVFFLHVVRCNSVTDAAKQYGISPSAGSRWLTELEENMGVSLVKRTTRKITPTQAGKLLFKQFSHINNQITDAINEIKNLGNDDIGTIRIASTPLFAKHFLSKIIGEYISDNPTINFVVIETAFEVDNVHDVDFAIRANATYRGFQNKDSLLVKRSLFSEPLKACCSPSYIQRYGEPIIPHDLKKHLCLFATTLVGGNKWIFEQNGEYNSVQIPRSVEVDDSEILKNIALAGGGIAYLPYSLIKQDLQDDRLVTVLNNYVSSEFELSLYYKPRKYMPVRCANFKDYLLKRVTEIDQQRKNSDTPLIF